MSKTITQSELHKSTLRRVRVFLQPSLFSGLLVMSIATYQAVATFLSSNTGLVFFDESATIFSEQLDRVKLSSGVSDTINTVFENPLVNQVTYIMVWASVGALVYFCIVLLSRGFEPFKDLMLIKTYNESHRKDFFNDTLLRLVVRFFVFCVAAVYTVFMINLIVPVSIGLMEIGASLIPGVDGCISFLQGYTVLALSLYMTIILLRFMLLRARVFGSADTYFS